MQRIIKRNNLNCRSLSESQFTKINKTPNNKLFDSRWLEDQHLNLNKSCKEIGKELNLDPDTIRRHMKKYGIHVKNNSESKVGLMIGEKHPNWKGGKTQLKKLLREYSEINLSPIAAKRDNYQCQLCGKTHTILHIHHIIPFNEIYSSILLENKNLNPNDEKDLQELYKIITNDKRFTDTNNLITLCKNCHFYEIHNYKHKKTISSQASKKEGSETIL